MSRAWQVVIALAATCIVAAAPLWLVGARGLTWFASLAQPPLTPPEASFASMWFVLNVCAVLAFWFVTTARYAPPHEGTWRRFYFVHLLFAIGWLVFLFRLHAIVVAFFAALFFSFIVCCLALGAWERDKRAAYLFGIYFAATVFFAFLNLNLLLLN